jgi:hypothetical protein
MPPESIIAILAGLGVLITAICTGMRQSKCTEIDCGCLHIEREVTEFTDEFD